MRWETAMSTRKEEEDDLMRVASPHGAFYFVLLSLSQETVGAFFFLL